MLWVGINGAAHRYYVLHDPAKQSSVKSGYVRLERMTASHPPLLLEPVELERFIARQNFRSAPSSEADQIRAAYRRESHNQENIALVAQILTNILRTPEQQTRDLLNMLCQRTGLTPRQAKTHIEPYKAYLEAQQDQVLERRWQTALGSVQPS